MTSQIPNWLPNWEHENAYPDIKTTSPRIWAWEYLRRNNSYQIECADIGEEWFADYRKLFFKEAGIEEKELKQLINPNYENLHKPGKDIYTTLARSCFEALKKIAEPNCMDDLRERFQVTALDHPKEPLPLVIFSTDLYCYRLREKNVDLTITVDECPTYPSAERLRFSSIRPKINERLNRYIEIVQDNLVLRDPGSKMHRDYLRVFDANLQCAKDSKIAEIIYGDSSKTPRIDKNLTIATEYVNRKYLALPPPFSPKSYNFKSRKI